MNRYPMKATIDGAIVRNLRLVSENGRSTVWEWDAEASTGRTVVEIEGSPNRVGATTSWQVGDFVLDEQRGCGCSHPMYSWVPPVEAATQP